MKKIVLLTIVVFMTSCVEKEDGIKVIKNYDDIYYPKAEVESKIDTEEEFDKVINDLREVASNYVDGFSQPAVVKFNHRIYISEKGKVDAVKEITSVSSQMIKNENVKNIFGNEATNLLVKAADKWLFSPAVKDGNPVKFRVDLIYSIKFGQEGDIVEETSTFKSVARSKISENDVYYVVVEQQPTPIGGLQAIQEKIKYPAKAKNEGIEGRVFVKAYINERGEVDEVTLLKGIHNECDSVAMAAIKQTKFTPGMQRGEPVKVQVSIPIVFKLQ